MAKITNNISMKIFTASPISYSLIFQIGANKVWNGSSSGRALTIEHSTYAALLAVTESA